MTFIILPTPGAVFRASHRMTEALLGPQHPLPALPSLQVWWKGRATLSRRGVGDPGLVCRVEGLLLSSSPSLLMVRGKGGATSPEQTLEPPSLTGPHTGQGTGHRAGGRQL